MLKFKLHGPCSFREAAARLDRRYASRLALLPRSNDRVLVLRIGTSSDRGTVRSADLRAALDHFRSTLAANLVGTTLCVVARRFTIEAWQLGLDAGFAVIALDDMYRISDATVDEVSRVVSENRVGEWARGLLDCSSSHPMAHSDDGPPPTTTTT